MERLTTLNSIDWRRIALFTVIAYGLSWLVGLILWQMGGLESPFATLLIAGAYMPAPALAHVLTRLITREGWRGTFLRPHRHEALFWLLAWLGTPLLVILGAIIYFVLQPEFFDASLAPAAEIIAGIEAQTGQPVPISPWALVGLQAAQALLLAPAINALFTFGEEFGWRAYLQPRLMPLGRWQALLIVGTVWGLWHAPLIAMGHNYGAFEADYPGAPWSGTLMMTLFTIAVSVWFGWLVDRSGSVWPAVIGHGALNGLAGLPFFFVRNQPNPLLGPYAFGLLGMLGFVIAAAVILLVPRLWPQAGPAQPEEAPTPQASITP